MWVPFCIISRVFCTNHKACSSKILILHSSPVSEDRVIFIHQHYNDIILYLYVMFNSGFSNPWCLWQCLWQKRWQTWLYKTFIQTDCMEQSRRKPEKGLLGCSPPLQTKKKNFLIISGITCLMIYPSAKTSHWVSFLTSTLKFWKNKYLGQS